MTVKARGESILAARLRENPSLSAVHERVKQIIPIDKGHDFFHSKRVAGLTLQIFTEELQSRESREPSTLEQDQCVASALLHDCVPIAKDSPLRKESARLCSEKAEAWLQEFHFAEFYGVPATIAILPITDAILNHSFSSGRVPSHLLGQALQDADRLEALGALGLFRTIATGVSIGAEFFDSSDPWAEKRPLDDRKFTVDHFFTKLLKLPASFRTLAAQAEAERRANFLKLFIEQLRSEITN